MRASSEAARAALSLAAIRCSTAAARTDVGARRTASTTASAPSDDSGKRKAPTAAHAAREAAADASTEPPDTPEDRGDHGNSRLDGAGKGGRGGGGGEGAALIQRSAAAHCPRPPSGGLPTTTHRRGQKLVIPSCVTSCGSVAREETDAAVRRHSSLCLCALAQRVPPPPMQRGLRTAAAVVRRVNAERQPVRRGGMQNGV